MRLCTVTTIDRLPQTRVLAASWARHHPTRPLAVIVDDHAGRIAPADEPFDLMRPSDLGGCEQPPRAAEPGRTPAVIRALLKRHERLIHLDPDVLVIAPLDTVAEALEQAEIVLAPRRFDPAALDGADSLEEIRERGAYDTGVLAFRRGPESERMLAWWDERCRTAAPGVHPGRWLDLVPGLFSSVRVLTDADIALDRPPERPARTDGADATASDPRPDDGTDTTGSAPWAGSLQAVAPGDDLGLRRGEAVVCIPLHGAHDLFARCLTSVLEHTPRHVPILVADDAGPDPASRRLAERLADSGSLAHRLLWLRQPRNLGFVENVNAAFELCAPADVVVLNSDCVVAGGWFEGLRDACYVDTNVATATALTNHGTIVSVPIRNHPLPDLPQDVDFATVAGTVRAESLRIRPRIPTCVGHCIYVRRDALELVGPFDPALSPAYGEEVDFSQRCLVHGLVHVVADDVLVLHRQGGSLGEDGAASPLQAEHDRLVAARYPYYDRFQRDAGRDEHSPLARALGRARRSMSELTVTIDARTLGPILTGTQRHVLELVTALDRTGELGLRVIVPGELGSYARDILTARPHVTLIDERDVRKSEPPRSSVVHRPLQVADHTDLHLLAQLGERAVVTHQDLIAFHNPGYFPGYPQFAAYREVTRRALAFADAVAFFSRHAAREAVGEQLVEPERAHVVHIGVDHIAVAGSGRPARPAGCEQLGEREVLLCLGTDFRHKNRLFALRIVEQLQLRHGWEGRIVLAGPRVQDGSSAGDEAEFLATRPRVAAATVGLPAVSEAEKDWLLDRADAVLFPTLYEGFGLMPFEAAQHGTPAFWSAQTSLAEVLPRDAAMLVAWDPRDSADAVIGVLRDDAQRADLVETVRRAGERFRWDTTARRLVELYREVAAAPPRPSRALAVEVAALATARDELERRYDELAGGFTDDGRRLVGAGGLLAPDQQWLLRRVLERGVPLAAFGGALSATGRIARAPRRTEAPKTDGYELALHWEWLNRRDGDGRRPAPDPLVIEPEPS